MATAVQPTPPAAAKGSPRAALAFASLVGAAFVLGGVAATAYLLPSLWATTVAPVLGGPGGAALRFVAQLALVVLFARIGGGLAGATAPRGIRGGITLAIAALITVFFIVRRVGLSLEGQGAAVPITAAVFGALLVGVYRFLASAGAQKSMVTIEDQGWLHTFSYKRSQGGRIRRYTLLGLLLLGWSGVYSLVASTTGGAGDWTLRLPFTDKLLPLLPDVNYTLPILLAALTFWVSWRAVNVPTFADFLIATEAEMNKVSWPTRRGLIQDTVVVLTTTALLTLFLLAVDVFWGALLSNQYIQVLPGKAAQQPGAPAANGVPNW